MLLHKLEIQSRLPSTSLSATSRATPCCSYPRFKSSSRSWAVIISSSDHVWIIKTAVSRRWHPTTNTFPIWPRLKFELRVSSDTQLDPDFTTLLDETNALRDQYQQDFKNKVLQAAELECKVLKAQAAELVLASKSFYLGQDTFNCVWLDPRWFINMILDRNHESALLHLEDNLDSFRTLYKTKNCVAGLPDPFPASNDVT
jgi:hypothetical protein